jgi:hypothetical protein
VIDAVLAAEAQAEAITVAVKSSSFTMSPDHLEEDTGPAPGSGSSRGPDIVAAVTVPPAPVVDEDDEDELRPSKKQRDRPRKSLAKHFLIDSNRMTCKSCRTTISKQSSKHLHICRGAQSFELNSLKGTNRSTQPLPRLPLVR